MPNVIVADDHPIVRSGIRHILKSYFGQSTQIYEAENGDQIVDHCKQHAIDIVLMDLNMPQTDPQGIVLTLLAMRPEIKILILSMNKEVIFGPLYLKLGAKGFVPKELGEQELLKALHAVMDGKVYMRSDMKDFYLGNAGLENPYGVLTKKEMEILRHLAIGESVAQIARTMSLGVTTISTHKANIFQKLQINNLFELKSMLDVYPL